MKCRGIRSTWFVPVFLFLAGCGSAPPPLESSVLSSASETGEYLIGPGDKLDIFVWGQPELSVTVPVRPDGRVSTPLIDDLVAVGKTPTQLAEEMQEVLSEYVRSPEVNVIVQDFVGTFGDQIRVLGQVEKPGAVPFRERMTLLDVIMEVGGLSRFAAGNRGRRKWLLYRRRVKNLEPAGPLAAGKCAALVNGLPYRLRQTTGVKTG